MGNLFDLFAPLNLHGWYVLAAFLLALGVQISKQTRYASTLWRLLPARWRWVWTALSGFAVGFVTGYRAGLPAVGAVLSGIGGALGVGTLAGGLNDWLEKSVLPWPGSPPKPGPSSGLVKSGAGRYSRTRGRKVRQEARHG